MKIAVSAGHNHYAGGAFDNGTSGYGRVEAKDTKATARLVKKGLEAKGHTVIDVTPYNEKFSNQKAAHVERGKRVKKHNPDLYLDIHLNYGGGTGPECWIYPNSSSRKYATKICNNIAKTTGLFNRGVKTSRSYWSLILQPQPSIIIEGAFMDNKKDMQRLTVEKYAKAIVDAFPDIKSNPKPKPVTKPLYRVKEGSFNGKQNGAYTELENAKKQADKLGGNWKVFDESGNVVYPKTHWSDKHFKYLESVGLGFNDYRPNDVLTRGEFAAYMERVVRKFDKGK